MEPKTFHTVPRDKEREESPAGSFLPGQCLGHAVQVDSYLHVRPSMAFVLRADFGG